MADEIFFDGVKYISASEAAESSDLTRDYVARLCRTGKVRGRQVGKNWYVAEESLASFLLNQSYLKAKRREELVHERLNEYREGPVQRVLEETPQAVPRQDLLPKTLILRNALANAAAKSPFPQGAIHAAASAGSHLVLSPFTNFVHKLIALTVALLMTVGTYAFVNPDAASYAAKVLRD